MCKEGLVTAIRLRFITAFEIRIFKWNYMISSIWVIPQRKMILTRAIQTRARCMHFELRYVWLLYCINKSAFAFLSATVRLPRDLRLVDQAKWQLALRSSGCLAILVSFANEITRCDRVTALRYFTTSRRGRRERAVFINVSKIYPCREIVENFLSSSRIERCTLLWYRVLVASFLHVTKTIILITRKHRESEMRNRGSTRFDNVSGNEKNREGKNIFIP